LAIVVKWIEEKCIPLGVDRPPKGIVKFCGGCNPLIERGDVANRIRQELGNQVRWAREGEEADLAVMINGCPMACADRPHCKNKPKAFLVIQGDSVAMTEEISNNFP
jgi:hypothetical protein